MSSRRTFLIVALVAGGFSRCDCGFDLGCSFRPLGPVGSPCATGLSCDFGLTCCHDTTPWGPTAVCVEHESECVQVDFGEPCVVDRDCFQPLWCSRDDSVCADCPFPCDGGVDGGADARRDALGDGASDAEAPDAGAVEGDADANADADADSDGDGGGDTDAALPDGLIDAGQD